MPYMESVAQISLLIRLSAQPYQKATLIDEGDSRLQISRQFSSQIRLEMCGVRLLA